MNLAIGGSFPGNPDNTTPFPSEMLIDYVRMYFELGSDSKSRSLGRMDPIDHAQNACDCDPYDECGYNDVPESRNREQKYQNAAHGE